MRDPRNDAQQFFQVPDRSDLTYGRNARGFAVHGPNGSTSYAPSLELAVRAHDLGEVFGYGQGSTHQGYGPGIGESPVDPHLIAPQSGLTGTRGVRMEFGGYGRLYRSPKYYHLERASAGDRGTLIGRSGTSGLRGGRPSFGGDPPPVSSPASFEFGPVRYSGDPVGATALGITALILLFKGPLKGM